MGSGTLFIVMLTMLFPLWMPHDVTHSAILTAEVGLMHLAFGNVDLVLAANILASPIPGVLAGSRLTGGVPEEGLRALVAMVLMDVGLKLL